MKLNLLLLFSLILFLVGCAPSSTFYWGDYSVSLYDYTKTPDDNTLSQYKKSLMDIIVVSPKKNKQVPPGVYAEYGFLLVKEGKTIEGLEYFDKEVLLYPESKIFIERIKDEIARGEK